MKFELRWYDSLFILLFFYLFVLQIQAIWPFTIDDMYISLRYAKHWVFGKGLLWNVHAPPVEGYSSFSFVVLGAITLILKGNPVVMLKMAGLIGLFFTCFFIYLISRFWFPRRESLLPCLSLLFYKGQIIWAISGLETADYEALICGSVYFCFRGMGYQLFPAIRKKPHFGYFVFAGILLCLAGMTRPEAPVLMALFFILICWDSPKEEAHKYWQGAFLFCLSLFVFYVPYFFWRLIYFGFLFPNSVYCKALSPGSNFLLDINYLKLIWPFAILAIPACIKAEDKRHYFLWLPSFLYLIMLADSDPVVAFDNRLFLPAFAVLLPLVFQGINIALYTMSKILQNAIFSLVKYLGYLSQKRVILLFYISTIVIVLLFIPSMSLVDYRYFTQNPLHGEQLRIKVLHWLNTHVNPGNNVVFADSGMVPYFSNLNFIDSYCLNNLTMGHYPQEQRYELFCNKILRQKPDVIILTSLIEHKKVMYTPSDTCLKVMLNKQTEYKLKKVLISNNQNSSYRYEIFTR